MSSELVDKVAERPDILGGKAQRPLEPLDLPATISKLSPRMTAFFIKVGAGAQR